MKILVLGGTGAMGKHLVQLLAKDNNEVFVTSRVEREDYNNVKYIMGNAQELDFLKKVLLSNNWDAIVDFMSYTTIDFSRRVEILLKSARHYIFLSSARVYSNFDDVITEETPRLLDISEDYEYLATDEYALAKARQEDLLKSSNNKNWTIVRPYITYSEARLQLGPLEKECWLYRVLHDRTVVFPEELLPKLTTLTYGADVALAIKSLVQNNTSYGKIYHITNNNSITWEKVLKIYTNVLEKILGIKPKIKLVSQNEFLKFYSGKAQIIYDRMYNRVFNNSKINNFIDVSNFACAEVGLSKCLEQFLKKGKTLRIANLQVHAGMDKITGDVTELLEFDTENGIQIYLEYLNNIERE